MDIIVFILVLGINILIHEFAHFYFARKADILCHEFAIGMGPVVWQKKKGETVYSIRAIPLGGYVSMAGEEASDFVKAGKTVGINLDEEGNVNEIILNNDTKYEYIGEVIDVDLYGLDDAPLFITLKISGEERRFNVNVDAKYILTPKKQMQLSIANRSYENKSLWHRLKVVAAGPISNFLLAFIILFVLAFFIGKPNAESVIGKVDDSAKEFGLNVGDKITAVNDVEVNTYQELSTQIYSIQSDKVTLGVNGDTTIEMPLLVVFQGLGFTNERNSDELIIGQVFGRTKNLKAGDEIKQILISDNIKSTDEMQTVTTWDELISYVSDKGHLSEVKITVLRDGSDVTDTYNNIKSETLSKLGASYVGYSIGIEGTSSFNILYPLYFPFVQMGSDFSQMFTTIGLLVSPGSGVGLGDLAGPVGIYSLVSNALSGGAVTFFIFVAFLSVNIGFLNLLPIPALDGGRIVFIIYEAITKKKVNKNFENILITITFILLLMLMVFVTFQDILRLFG